MTPIVFLLSTMLSAQADPPSGGEVVKAEAYAPPRLLAQAELHYPQEALEQRIHGDVVVEVLVDDNGVVVDVVVVEGDPVFHQEAEAAGHRLAFAPATQGSNAVPATVTVFFHFAPPQADGELPTAEVIVYGVDHDARDTRSRTTLTELDIERSVGDDLARATAEVSGVTVSRGNSNTSKPIIRGQAERRLLLIHDGVRHESQKWGADHAPEIDPLSAGSITVVKGAAGARYGPDAIGGVVLVNPVPMRDEAGVGGRVLLGGASNGWRGTASLRVDAVPSEDSPWSFRLQASGVRGASQRAPSYVLGNTAVAEWSVGGSAQLRTGRTLWRGSISHFDNRSGVFYGVGLSRFNEETGQVGIEPVGADAWVSDYDIDRPFQHVSHTRGTLHVDREGPGGGRVQAIYAYQYNLRKEYDRARASIKGSQFEFNLQTHTVDLLVEHEPLDTRAGTFEGGVGGQALAQIQVYRGLPLLPNYTALSGGLFGYERWVSDGAVEVVVGGRIDHLDRTAYLGELHYEQGVREDVFDADRCDRPGERFVCPASWTAGSVSVGALWHALRDRVDLKFDLSSASRIPGPDEQYIIGTAPTVPVYSVGNGDLGIETTWNASTTVGVRLPWLEGEVSAWGSLVDDYIYFAPVFNATGNPRVDVTIRGSWPRFGHEAVPARFSGIDGQIDVGPSAVVGARVAGAVVRAVRRDNGQFLVGTPPDRAKATVWWRPRPVGALTKLQLGASLEGVAEQTRTDPATEIAAPPAAYALVGLSAEAELTIAERPARLGIVVNNLLNTTYRDYTSLLRYYADFPGRDIRLRMALDF